MKTRAKSLFHLLISTMLLVGLMSSCGKENESGGNSGYNGISGTYGNINGNSSWFTTLQREIQCSTGSTNRTRVVLNISNYNVNINAGSVHVGVTQEGDLAVISKNNNQAIAEIYSCARPNTNMNQQHSIIDPQIVVNQSNYCDVGEISKLSTTIRGTYGDYTFYFYPLHYHNQRSQLCM